MPYEFYVVWERHPEGARTVEVVRGSLQSVDVTDTFSVKCAWTLPLVLFLQAVSAQGVEVGARGRGGGGGSCGAAREVTCCLARRASGSETSAWPMSPSLRMSAKCT